MRGFFHLLCVALVLMSTGFVSADSIQDLNRTASRYNMGGMWEEALKIYEQILVIEPNNSWSLNQKAFLLGNLARWDEATTALEAALRFDEKNVELWQIYANALYYTKQYEEALQAIEEIWKLDYKKQPRSWNAYTYFLKAKSLRALGRNDEALKAFDDALSNDPDYTKVMNEKGELLMDMGKYPEALDLYNDVLKKAPRFGKALENKKIAEEMINSGSLQPVFNNSSSIS